MRIRPIVSAVPFVLAAVLAACGGSAADKSPTPPGGGGSTTAALSSLNVHAPTSSIAIGGTVQVDASALDRDGNVIGATVTWSSQNDTVATVAGAGLVTGAKMGTTLITVTASAGGVKLSRAIWINVIPQFVGPPPPRNVLVNDPRRSAFLNIAQFEPTIAVSGSRVVVAWNDESFGDQVIRGINWSVGYGYSSDGGSTFIEAGELGGSHWGADPTAAVDRAGHFYLARLDLLSGAAGGNASSPDRIAIYRSTDGGMTFPQSATVTGNASGGFCCVNDKPTITIDNTGGLFDGNVYASWTLAGSNVLKINFVRSTDNGVSYSAPLVLSDGRFDQYSVPAVGPNGEVYVLWVDGISNTIVIRKSTDQGVTFAPAVSVASLTPIGALVSNTSQYCGRVLNGSVRVSSSPMIAIDKSAGPNRGKLYVVFGSGGAGSDMADVFMTTSSDGGAWSTPRRLNDDMTTNDQWLPFVVVAPNGKVGVSWYDRRQDPQNLLIDVFMRISTDGGASFGPNLKITDVSFPPPGLNYKLGFPPYSCYMSSYNYMTADATNFYIVWTDNRMVSAGVVDPNIMFAKVPH